MGPGGSVGIRVSLKIAPAVSAPRTLRIEGPGGGCDCGRAVTERRGRQHALEGRFAVSPLNGGLRLSL